MISYAQCWLFSIYARTIRTKSKFLKSFWINQNIYFSILRLILFYQFVIQIAFIVVMFLVVTNVSLFHVKCNFKYFRAQTWETLSKGLRGFDISQLLSSAMELNVREVTNVRTTSVLNESFKLNGKKITHFFILIFLHL